MTAVADDAVPRLPRGVRLREDPERGWVLLAPERVLVADRVASEILKRCDGKTTVAALVDDLARSFAAPRERIDADVKKLLADLADKRVLDLASGPS